MCHHVAPARGFIMRLGEGEERNDAALLVEVQLYAGDLGSADS